MKKYQYLSLAAMVILMAICIPVFANNEASGDSNTPISQTVFGELPNITVVDQYGNPVQNVKLSVLYEGNGESSTIEVTTPKTGFVPISGKPGTYTYTITAAPADFSVSNQKVVQEYRSGAALNEKQIMLYRNSENPMAAGSSAGESYYSATNFSFGDFMYDPTFNFATNISVEFKSFMKSIVKEVIKEIEEEEKDANPTPVPTPTPEPTPEPTPVPSPDPTPEEVPDPSPTTNPTPGDDIPDEYKRAIQITKDYGNILFRSRQAIYETLISRFGYKLSPEAANYGVDNAGIDYKYNALQIGLYYYEEKNMSREEVRNQLSSPYGEKFTQEEADYAVANLP